MLTMEIYKEMNGKKEYKILQKERFQTLLFKLLDLIP